MVEPDGGVLLASSNSSIKVTLLPVDPHEVDTLVVDQVTNHNVLDGIGNRRIYKVHRHDSGVCREAKGCDQICEPVFPNVDSRCVVDVKGDTEAVSL